MDYDITKALYRRTVDLNHKEVVILFALAGAAKNKDTLPSPSIKRLADRAGMAIGTATDTLKTLSEKKIITIAKRKTAKGQMCNLYKVNTSALGVEKPVAESEERVQTCEPSRVQTCEPLKSSKESSEGVQKSSNCGNYNNIDNNIDNNNKTDKTIDSTEGGLGGTNQPQKSEDPKSQASKSVCHVVGPFKNEKANKAYSKLTSEGMPAAVAEAKIRAVQDDWQRERQAVIKRGWTEPSGKAIDLKDNYLVGMLVKMAKEGPRQPQEEEPQSLEEIFNLLKREWGATYPEVADYIARYELDDVPHHLLSKLQEKEDAHWKSVKGSRVAYVRNTLGGTIYERVQDWRQRETKELQNHLAVLEQKHAGYKHSPDSFFHTKMTVDQKIAELANSITATKSKLARLTSQTLGQVA